VITIFCQFDEYFKDIEKHNYVNYIDIIFIWCWHGICFNRGMKKNLTGGREMTRIETELWERINYFAPLFS